MIILKEEKLNSVFIYCLVITYKPFLFNTGAREIYHEIFVESRDANAEAMKLSKRPNIDKVKLEMFDLRDWIK